MSSKILSKIRKLNWVLTESTTGSFSYGQLSEILSQVLSANVYITDSDGKVLGTGYINKEDSSLMVDRRGMERLVPAHNENFLQITETKANIKGVDILRMFGSSYEMSEKYHCIIPSFCGGKRLGTLIAARYEEEFSEEDIALCEYGAAVVGLEIQRNNRFAREEENRLKGSVDLALSSLSASEKEAVITVLKEFRGDEGDIVTSKIAEKYHMTNSLVVNALRKLESAGIIRARSMGMRGTRILIINPFFRKEAEKLR